MVNYGFCPNCNGKLLKRNGRFGAFLSCSNFPKCRFSMDYKHDYGNLHENALNNINSINKETFSFQNEKYQSKVKLAREFVSSNLNTDFEQFLIDKKWDEDVELCMHVFNSNVTNEDKRYIESVLGYAHHRRDKRTSLEYACDLMVGWIIEDCTVDILNGLLCLIRNTEDITKDV